MKTNTHFLSLSRSVLLRMGNVSDRSRRENKTAHFIFSNFFRKSCRLSDNVEKYSTSGESTEDNMALGHSGWVP